MHRFRSFHEIFRQYIAEYEEYIQNFNVAKLHEVNSQGDDFEACLLKEFDYLPKVAKPDFILDNFRSSLQSCPVPSDDPVLRGQILSLKVKLGAQSILAASTMPKVPLSQQELADTVSSLVQSQRRQEAQLNALFSLVGNVEGLAAVVNACID